MPSRIKRESSEYLCLFALALNIVSPKPSKKDFMDALAQLRDSLSERYDIKR